MKEEDKNKMVEDFDRELEEEMMDYKKRMKEFRREVLKKGRRPAIRYRYDPNRNKKLKDFTPAGKAEYLLQSLGQLKLITSFQDENPFTKHFMENLLSKMIRMFPLGVTVRICLGLVWKKIKGMVRHRYYDTAERLRFGRGYWNTLFMQERYLQEEEGKRWDGMTTAERLEDERNALLDNIKAWRVDLYNEKDENKQARIRQEIATAEEEIQVIMMKEAKNNAELRMQNDELKRGKR